MTINEYHLHPLEIPQNLIEIPNFYSGGNLCFSQVEIEEAAFLQDSLTPSNLKSHLKKKTTEDTSNIPISPQFPKKIQRDLNSTFTPKEVKQK